MRLIPRRKRTWLLVLLGVAIVGATAICWAASGKSEFEKRFDRVRIGMSVHDAVALLDPQIPIPGARLSGLPSSKGQTFIYAVDDELAELFYDDAERITAKEFNRPTITERLRRMWTQTFGSKPPF